MQTARCLIKTSPTHTIPRPNITPLEAQVLVKLHSSGAGENPIIEAVQTADVPGKNEFERVANFYGRPLVESMYPGVVKKIPQTFEEVGIKLVTESKVQSAPNPVDLETDLSAQGASEVVLPVASAPAPVEESVPVKPAKTSKSKLP